VHRRRRSHRYRRHTAPFCTSIVHNDDSVCEVYAIALVLGAAEVAVEAQADLAPKCDLSRSSCLVIRFPGAQLSLRNHSPPPSWSLMGFARSVPAGIPSSFAAKANALPCFYPFQRSQHREELKVGSKLGLAVTASAVWGSGCCLWCSGVRGAAARLMGGRVL